MATAPQPNPAPKKGHAVRNIGIGCGGLLVLLIIIVAIANAGNKATVGGGNPSSGQATSCAPKPCADADGFKVNVSGLNRNASASEFTPPEAGNHYVVMQVTMKNDSNDSKNANPFDFKLRDSKGQEHDITFASGGGCDTWQAVDLAKGASLGPKPLCFQASGDPNAALTLIWSPGFFSSKVDIPLQ